VDALTSVDSRIGDDASNWLTVRSALERRDVAGGTAPARVARACAAARERLDAERGVAT
jgi:argininosuccinate lyase